MNLLVIDDNAASRLVLNKILSRGVLNGTVWEAASAWEGLHLIEKTDPAVVFADIFMPGFDGVKLLETIRQHEQYEDLPVVVVTSSTEPEHVRTMIALKVIGYVLKPVRPEVVIEQLVRIPNIEFASRSPAPTPKAPAVVPNLEEAAASTDQPYGAW